MSHNREYNILQEPRPTPESRCEITNIKLYQPSIVNSTTLFARKLGRGSVEGPKKKPFSLHRLKQKEGVDWSESNRLKKLDWNCGRHGVSVPSMLEAIRVHVM
jgi:hypothetical protein